MERNLSDMKWLALFFVVVFFFWLAVVNPYLIGYDQAVYYNAAEAILDGNGYVMASHPDMPPDTYRPFLFSLWLSTLMLVSRNIYFLKFTQLLFHFGSGCLLYAIVSAYYSKKVAFLSTVLLWLNPFFLIYSSLIMSEMPYIFLSLLALYFFMPRGKPYDEGVYVFLSGAATGIAFLMRNIGITLFAALFISTLYKRKNWLPFLVGFLLVGGWYLPQFAGSMALDTGGTGFMVEQSGLERIEFVELSVGTVAARLLSGASYYRGLPVRFAGSAGYLAYPILLAGALLYFAKCHKKELNHILLYSILFLGIIAWWPWRDIRFILPVLVFAFPAVAACYEWVEGKLAEKKPAIKDYYPFVVLLIILLAIPATHILGKSFQPDQGWVEYIDTLEHLSTLPSGTVSARRCGEAYFYSGMMCVGYPLSHDRALLHSQIGEYGIGYFLYDSLSWTSATETYYGWVLTEGMVSDMCFKEIYATGSTKLYEIMPCTSYLAQGSSYLIQHSSRTV